MTTRRIVDWWMVKGGSQRWRKLIRRLRRSPVYWWECMRVRYGVWAYRATRRLR